MSRPPLQLAADFKPVEVPSRRSPSWNATGIIFSDVYRCHFSRYYARQAPRASVTKRLASEAPPGGSRPRASDRILSQSRASIADGRRQPPAAHAGDIRQSEVARRVLRRDSTGRTEHDVAETRPRRRAVAPLRRAPPETASDGRDLRPARRALPTPSRHRRATGCRPRLRPARASRRIPDSPRNARPRRAPRETPQRDGPCRPR